MEGLGPTEPRSSHKMAEVFPVDVHPDGARTDVETTEEVTESERQTLVWLHVLVCWCFNQFREWPGGNPIVCVSGYREVEH